MSEFTLPEELQDVDYNSILAQMLAKVPDQYDKLEGSFVYDMIAPSALEAAELIQLWLALGLKMNFHFWASGVWLDHHAHDCGLSRHAATCAYVDVKVTTTQAVTFPKGFIFSVPADGSDPSIDFETTEEIICAAADTYTLRLKAVAPDVGSNVAAHSIKIMKTPIKGISAIDNPAAATGGTPAEDDESLRQRISDFYAGHGHSYVGNRADYIRWAKSIDGVGFVNCIPTYDGENSVKLIISDTTGKPANREKLQQVANLIFGEGSTELERHNDLNRLAPIGVQKWAVVAPETKDIYIKLSAKLSADENYVKKNIAANLSNYFATLADENNSYGELKIQKVAAILSNATGIDDFKNLQLGLKVGGEIVYGSDNLSFDAEEFPYISTDNIVINSWA